MLEKRIALPLFWLLTQRIDPKLREFKLKRRIAVAA